MTVLMFTNRPFVIEKMAAILARSKMKYSVTAVDTLESLLLRAQQGDIVAIFVDMAMEQARGVLSQMSQLQTSKIAPILIIRVLDSDVNEVIEFGRMNGAMHNISELYFKGRIEAALGVIGELNSAIKYWKEQQTASDSSDTSK